MTLKERIEGINKKLEYITDSYSGDLIRIQQAKEDLLFKELPKLLDMLKDSASTLSYIQMEDAGDDTFSLDYYQSYGRQQRIIENQRKHAEDCLKRLNK